MTTHTNTHRGGRIAQKLDYELLVYMQLGECIDLRNHLQDSAEKFIQGVDTLRALLHPYLSNTFNDEINNENAIETFNQLIKEMDSLGLLWDKKKKGTL